MTVHRTMPTHPGVEGQERGRRYCKSHRADASKEAVPSDQGADLADARISPGPNGKLGPMARHPISSRLHGILDYTTGATLIAAPAALGLGGTAAGRILRGAGAGHAGYAALTRYELGVVKVIPYRAHLAMDAVA